MSTTSIVVSYSFSLCKTHLEGHDEMSEVKLCFQIKLDGDILHTCKHLQRYAADQNYWEQHRVGKTCIHINQQVPQILFN